MPSLWLIVFVLVAALLGFTGFSYGRALRLGGVNAAWIVVYAVFFAGISLIMIRNVIGFSRKLTGFAEELKQWVMAIWFVVIVYSAVIFIMRAIVRLVIRIAGKCGCAFDSLLVSGRFVAAVFVCTLVIGVIGCVNARMIKVKDYTVKVAGSAQSGITASVVKWTPGYETDGKDAGTSENQGYNTILKAAAISDLHMGTGLNEKGLKKLGEKLKDIDADVLFIVGDVTDNGTEEKYLGLLNAMLSDVADNFSLGMFYVEGNHDRVAPGLREAMQAAGVRVLMDDAVMLNDEVCLIGRKDRFENPRRLTRYSEEKVPKDAVKIVLTHQPSGLAELASDGASISISGHTHGEQFPLIYGFIALANDMVYGTKQFGDMVAITTSGVGEWGFKYKFPSSCEIVRLRVVK